MEELHGTFPVKLLAKLLLLDAIAELVFRDMRTAKEIRKALRVGKNRLDNILDRNVDGISLRDLLIIAERARKGGHVVTHSRNGCICLTGSDDGWHITACSEQGIRWVTLQDEYSADGLEHCLR